MTQPREKVVVAMSGGVDSSVAACLLLEQGYDVVGLFMRVGVKTPEDEAGASAAVDAAADDCRSETTETATVTAPPKPKRRLKQGCCSASDAADARFVAGMLGVPFYALNFQSDFAEIMDYFADEYVRGRTPNPCVVCNDRLKFGKLLDYADAVGAKYVATGHYARIGERDGRKTLMRGVDTDKDQSYVLFGLRQDVLDRVLFPVGDLTKPQVREVATRLNLPNDQKPDSVEICFVPDNDYARVVRERRPDAFNEGDVLNQQGAVIGQHKGIGHYTVGQRRGLGISAPNPIYVTKLDVLNNAVVTGEASTLLASSLLASRATFLVSPPTEPFRAAVKIRYLHRAAMATVTPLNEGSTNGSAHDNSKPRTNDRTVRVDFDEPQRAITPGQAVVFYDGDVVLGGAWIDSAE